MFHTLSKTARILLLGASLLVLPFVWSCGSSSDDDTGSADAVAEAMSAASSVADQQERAIDRAWAMAQVAIDWAALDPDAAQQAIADSVDAAEEAASGGDEQRSAAAELRELAADWDAVDWRSAIPLAERIERNASRAWVLRAIAGALADEDPDQAESLLADALDLARANPLPQYGAADESTVALELGKIDPDAALDAAEAIADPEAKARALRELVWQFGDSDPELVESTVAEAINAAGEISGPYDRAWALRKLAGAPLADAVQAKDLLGEAENAAAQIEEVEPQAFALSDIAAAYAILEFEHAVELVERIAANYPEARVAALVGIAEALTASDSERAISALEDALTENEEVLDTYEQARAVNVIVTVMAELDHQRAVELAEEIEDAYFQGDALRVLALAVVDEDAEQALALAEEIEPLFIRVQTLIAIGVEVAATDSEQAISIFEGALSEAGDLKDTYALRLLASAWAPVDAVKALDIADRVEDDGDRAKALTSVALAMLATDEARAQVLFETAEEKAQGIKSDDDPFAAATALQDLAAAWSSVDEAEAGRLYSAAFEAATAVEVEPTG
jgi:hypothetical protein